MQWATDIYRNHPAAPFCPCTAPFSSFVLCFDACRGYQERECLLWEYDAAGTDSISVARGSSQFSVLQIKAWVRIERSPH